jgi:ribosomal protein L11 methyltransferase
VIRLAVRCRPELAEQVLAELSELAPNGLEEEEGDGYVEYAIYGPPGELPALPDIEAATGEGLVSVSTTEIPDDWADRWRDFHTATEIAGGRLVIRPPWDPGPRTPGRGSTKKSSRRSREQDVRARAEDVAGVVDVVIDPGQAFGTGAHATTYLCLELLVELADDGRSGALVDWGTGSGVLAIAAAKLGFGPVSGYDHELAAVEAAAANARANGVELATGRLNLRKEAAPIAATAAANLTAPILHAVAERLEGAPEVLVASGMLHEEVDGVAEAFARTGLVEAQRRSRGDWSALLLSTV